MSVWHRQLLITIVQEISNHLIAKTIEFVIIRYTIPVTKESLPKTHLPIQEEYHPPQYVFYPQGGYYPRSEILQEDETGIEALYHQWITSAPVIEPYCHLAEYNWMILAQETPPENLHKSIAILSEIDIFVPSLIPERDYRLFVSTGSVLFKSSAHGEQTGLTIIESVPYITTGLYNRDMFNRSLVLIARPTNLKLDLIQRLVDKYENRQKKTNQILALFQQLRFTFANL